MRTNVCLIMSAVVFSLPLASLLAQPTSFPTPPTVTAPPTGSRELFIIDESELSTAATVMSDSMQVPEVPRFNRSRTVSIASNWMPNQGQTLHAALFEEESVDIVIDSTAPESGGIFTLGHIVDHPELQVFFGSPAI